MTRGFLIIGLFLALAIAGCGGSDGSSNATGAGGAETTPSSSERAAQGYGKPTFGTGAPEKFRPQPKVEVPNGPPPKQLQVKDLIVGDGPEAEAGKKIAVHYVLVDYESGKELASNWHKGEPGTYALGTGLVTEGWNKGLPGMRVGGRRELIVPPRLAFGAEGSPPIPPNATLIFLIDLVGVQ